MSLDDAVISRLAGIVGETHICPGERDDAIDGVVPTVVVSPGTVEEIADILRIANAEHLRVIPCGGRTMLSLGALPERCDILLSTGRLERALDHSPADLVATVEAGMPLDTLQKTLGEEGQMLPLDPPYAQSATIGGILSANTSGPKRLLYGGARDYLIGTRVVRPTGEIVRAGGIVVKNVTGYDMNKLYVGALGTLGVIVETTLKLQPIPETEGSLVAFCPSVEVTMLCVDAIRNSPLLPAALTVIDPDAHARMTHRATDRSYLLALCAEGVEPVVVRHRSSGTDLLRGAGAQEVSVLEREVSDAFWEKIRHLPYERQEQGMGSIRDTDSSSVVCRAVFPIAQGWYLFPLVHRIAQENGLMTFTFLHAGHGTGYCRLFADPDGLELDRLRRAVVALRGEIVRLKGYLIIESAPPALKRRVDVWGKRDGGDVTLMRMLRERFDPHAVINPGRFIV